MARFLRLCTWLLLLGPGLLATVRAECSQDCATCSYRLVRPADINFLVSVARGECCAPCETEFPQQYADCPRPTARRVWRFAPGRSRSGASPW
ncbi:PENK isoform 8 [Pongo abelii]|uniref:Proenkephalin-A n=1 Tax=Pongo abelii TaxID=9601 RepID=A0A2J8UNE5_PONAB|nr:PENK isoform 8 [Pongo abelii]